MTGSRYGRLVAIEQVPNESRNMPTWRFQCDCGTEVVRLAGHVRQGRCLSCGCLRREVAGQKATTHGKHGGPNYKLWRKMWGRCTVPTVSHYDRYGGRGIRVCERWQDFNLFLEDMGPRPTGYTIERIDNNGDYEPGNCRWASRTDQANNRSVTRWVITPEGRLPLAKYAQLQKESYGTIASRYCRATKLHEIEARFLEPKPREQTIAAMSEARRKYWEKRRADHFLRLK